MGLCTTIVVSDEPDSYVLYLLNFFFECGLVGSHTAEAYSIAGLIMDSMLLALPIVFTCPGYVSESLAFCSFANGGVNKVCPLKILGDDDTMILSTLYKFQLVSMQDI